jgi:glycine cleavage system regulatory protein
LRTSLVLTVIGADKPGLVEVLSKAVAAHGANWEESRMAHLGGQFAGILRVTVDEGGREALLRDLEGLERSGLRVVAADSGTPVPEPDTQLLRLELVSDDRAGIIRDIAQALARLGVNVEELSSEITSAPMSGGNLFRMHATLRAPEEVPLERVTRELEGLADELMVDLSLAALA